MKVKVSYTVERFTEIEIPDELANTYKEAYAKDDYDAVDFAYEGITEYVNDTMKQTDAVDWYDWEEVE